MQANVSGNNSIPRDICKCGMCNGRLDPCFGMCACGLHDRASPPTCRTSRVLAAFPATRATSARAMHACKHVRYCTCSNAGTCTYVCVNVSRLSTNWPLSFPAMLPARPGLEPPYGPSERLVETLKCNFPPQADPHPTP